MISKPVDRQAKERKTMDDKKDRFPVLKGILKTIGLPAEAIDDIIERILDWLSTKDEPVAGPATFPYKLRDDFLSNAELSFYQVLRAVVDDQLLICPKVNLADLFFVATGDHRKNRTLMYRIDRKHVDFLLCGLKTGKPMLGIELDDKSHDRPERRMRDELVESVFTAANLPLLRINVKTGYAPADLVSLINSSLGSSSMSSPVEAQPVTTGQDSEGDSAPLCPKCGLKMVLRTAQKGRNKGNQFWGCSSYPQCKSMLPVQGS